MNKAIPKFDDYLKSINENDFHPELNYIFKTIPKDLKDFRNLILYGPPNSGKYSKALQIIEKYSKNELKNQNIVLIPSSCGKYEYRMKISDIHYEVDMDLLGCNPKNLWNEILEHICEIVRSKYNLKCSGIILIKNLHKISFDLLENLYSIIRTKILGTTIKYIIITEAICFIPRNIIISSNIISFKKINLNKNNSITDDLPNSEKLIANKLFRIIKNPNEHTLSSIRQDLYESLIYNQCIVKIIYHLIKLIYLENKNNEKINKILSHSIQIIHYYNNNYRPIFHLERLLYGIVEILNE